MGAVLRPYPNLLRGTGLQVKPAGIPRIDWTHPLTKGLISYWFDTGNFIIDLVSGRRAVLGSNSTVIPAPGSSAYGRGLLYPGGAVQACLLDPLPANTPSWTFPYAFAMGWVPIGTGSASTDSFFGLADATNSVCIFNNATGTSALACTLELANSGTATATFTPLANTFNVMCGSATATATMTYFANGKTVAGTSSTAAVTGLTDLQFFFNSGANAPNSSTGGSVNALILFGAAWFHRALSQQDAALLYTNPYCFLLPQEGLGELPAVGVSAASGVGVGTANAIFTAAAISNAAAAESGTVNALFTAAAIGNAKAVEVGTVNALFTAAAIGTANAAEVGAVNALFTAAANTTATAKDAGEADAIFGAAGVSSAKAPEAGAVAAIFTASAVGAAAAAEQANAVALFTAASISSALAAEIGNANALFMASAIGASGGSASGSGEADAVFSASALGAAVAAARAEADALFTAAAISSSAASGSGAGESDALFTAIAVSAATSAQVGAAAAVFASSAVPAAILPPPPLPDANVNCAYATEDLTTVYATEDGSFVYAPAACFLPGAQGGVGWPDDKIRRKVPRKLLEKLLKRQRDNTFGRRWFAEFEEAQRKLANDNLAIAAHEAREVVEQIESTDTLDLHHDRINEIAAALQAAVQVKSMIDAIAAANFAIAKAWALREWIAELERDEEEVLWLLI